MALLNRLVVLALLAGACFSPEESDGTLRCGPEGECPEGFTCGERDRCWRDEPLEPEPTVDAAVPDDAGGCDSSSGPGCSGSGDD